MTVESCFAMPIYRSQFKATRLTAVQNELLRAVETIKQTGGFQKNKDWNEGTHKLSDTSFSRNAIEDYSLWLFKKELELHVIEFLKDIKTPIDRYCKFKVSTCWITQTNPGEHAHLHTHGSNDLAGVYYIKTDKKDGNFIFMNPLSLLKHSYLFEHLEDQIEYTPEEGTIVLFPGWLEHGVQTNKSTSERISISFNINFQRR